MKKETAKTEAVRQGREAKKRATAAAKGRRGYSTRSYVHGAWAILVDFHPELAPYRDDYWGAAGEK